MGTVTPPANSSVHTPPHAGPTVLRMLLGAHLRRLRETWNITREEAGAAIRASQSKISRLELGRTGFKLRDVADLLRLYRVEEPEHEVLLDLARQANAPAWWQAYGDVIPDWFESYLGLEQAAALVRTYQAQRIPDLLQTAEYAHALATRVHRGATPEENDRRVALLLERQRLLRQPNGPRLWALVDEAALCRPVDGTAALRRQLQHLIELSQFPSVTIQVVPFSPTGHATNGAPVTLLRFREDELTDVVYLEQLTNAQYLDKPADFDHYWSVMNSLAVGASPPASTRELLRRALREA